MENNTNDAKGRIVNIDCAPGPIRPNTYFEVICSKLGIEYFEPVNKFFGNWTWMLLTLTDEQLEVYSEFVPGYLKGLYESGKIRYASW